MTPRALSLLLAALVAVGCTSTMIVRAPPEPTGTSGSADDDDLGPFFQPLSPWGDWWWSDVYGWVYSPHVGPGWRPYTAGHWVMSDDGWLWVSSEPFGWACFHYGRWVWLDDAGWVWIPGRVWAPAWVVWRTGPGSVGWGPVGTVDVYPGPWGWVFVDERSFLAPDIVVVVVPPARNATWYPHTRVIHHPERSDVEHATGRPVVVHHVVDDERGARPGDVVMPRAHARLPVPQAQLEERPLQAPSDADVDRRYDLQRQRLLDLQARERRAPPPSVTPDELRARQQRELQQLDADKAKEKKADKTKRSVPRKVPKVTPLMRR